MSMNISWSSLMDSSSLMNISCLNAECRFENYIKSSFLDGFGTFETFGKVVQYNWKLDALIFLKHLTRQDCPASLIFSSEFFTAMGLTASSERLLPTWPQCRLWSVSADPRCLQSGCDQSAWRLRHLVITFVKESFSNDMPTLCAPCVLKITIVK